MTAVPLVEAQDPLIFGRKVTTLCSTLREGILVPDGYAISKLMVQKITKDQIDVRDDLQMILNELGSVAVRSSAIDEDGDSSSFAGQFTSYLNITTVAGMDKAIRLICESASSRRVNMYKEHLGIAKELEMSILLQKMVSADVSGIMFTRNPVTGSDEKVIEASWGLGEAIASGYVSPDYFRISRDGETIEKVLGVKNVAVRNDVFEGTIEAPLSNDFVDSFCLDEHQLIELNKLAFQCERIFGKNLDIEWAFEQGKLYLLQCRRITGLER
jgi:pyruvate,water dikinase